MSDHEEIIALKEQNARLADEVARLSLQVSELAEALKTYILCAKRCPCPDLAEQARRG